MMCLKKAFITGLSIIFIASSILGQDNPILFSVGDDQIKLDEFNYIYTKNNGDKADYSKESIDEYMDLYIKFKLKVQEAKSLGLDKDPVLMKELEGYRRQLADNYLADQEVTEKLLTEVWERKQEDRKVSHLFMSIPKGSSEKEKLTILNKAKDLRKRMDSEETFRLMAKQFSEDKNSAKLEGQLGYYTAMLPEGFYELENVIYSTPVGEISQPVSSALGVHIIRIDGVRPARGEMEIAHILIRKTKNGDPVKNAKAKADSIYQLLNEGAAFNDLAKKVSDDKQTAHKSGYLGFFGINQYEKSFEDAAFAIGKDGTFSKPIQTKIGYHIIKRISKKDYTDYNTTKRSIQAKIKKRSRYITAKNSLIDQIKVDSELKENKEELNKFISSLDDTFLTYKWSPNSLPPTELLSFKNGMTSTLSDFGGFLKKNSKERLRIKKDLPIEEAVNSLYEKFVNDQVMVYEESNLENKYPEFKALMREYNEGILLFEVTKQNVWDKASADTSGLKAFYEDHKQNYNWKDRAVVQVFSMQGADKKLMKDIIKYAKKKSIREIQQKYSDKLKLTVERKTYEEDHHSVKGLKFKAGEIGATAIDESTRSGQFMKVAEIIPSGPKTLDDAKGYILADYQDFLEKEWVANLRAKYPVKTNEENIKSIIKK